MSGDLVSEAGFSCPSGATKLFFRIGLLEPHDDLSGDLVSEAGFSYPSWATKLFFRIGLLEIHDDLAGDLVSETGFSCPSGANQTSQSITVPRSIQKQKFIYNFHNSV